LPRILPENPQSYIQAAVLLVQCARVSPEQKSHFYDRAMRILRDGVNRHQLDRGLLDQPQMAPLKDREDFRRLRQTPMPAVPGGAVRPERLSGSARPDGPVS
jgi:hypothetical protein